MSNFWHDVFYNKHSKLKIYLTHHGPDYFLNQYIYLINLINCSHGILVKVKRDRNQNHFMRKT